MPLTCSACISLLVCSAKEIVDCKETFYLQMSLNFASNFRLFSRSYWVSFYKDLTWLSYCNCFKEDACSTSSFSFAKSCNWFFKAATSSFFSLWVFLCNAEKLTKTLPILVCNSLWACSNNSIAEIRRPSWLMWLLLFFMPSSAFYWCFFLFELLVYCCNSIATLCSSSSISIVALSAMTSRVLPTWITSLCIFDNASWVWMFPELMFSIFSCFSSCIFWRSSDSIVFPSIVKLWFSAVN